MDHSYTDTPSCKKRPFLEVAISPDGKASMDTTDLRDGLCNILDEKFEPETCL